MHRIVRRRPSPAMAVALLALFVALGGSSYAVTVGPREIKTGAVTSRAVKDGAIRDRDVRADGLGGASVAEQRLNTRKLNVAGLPPVPTARDVTANSVDGDEIKPDAVRSPDIAPRAVNANELGDTVRRFGKAEPVATGTTRVAAISCSKGEQVVSGGGRWTEERLAGLSLHSSVAAGRSWRATGSNNSGSTQPFQAFVLCLKR